MRVPKTFTMTKNKKTKKIKTKKEKETRKQEEGKMNGKCILL